MTIRNRPDYHPFRMRRITADNLPDDERRRKALRGEPLDSSVMSDESRKTCDVCGGSRFSPQHISYRAWGPIDERLFL